MVKYDVFVGSETGLLKGLDIETNKWNNINQVSNVSRENEIRSLCYDGKEKRLLAGTRSHQVFSCDINTSEITSSAHLNGCSGKLTSIHAAEEKLITTSDDGIVRIWDSDYEMTSQFSAGSNLFCATQNTESRELIGTGGKETDLKIWNLNDFKNPVFEAKNVKNDWLNLRVPVWITGIQFIPMSEQIVTCTGHHQVRVYDPKVQRRPVLDMTFDEHPITAMALCPLSENYALVGNAVGKMATVDFRKGSVVNIFKGFAGCIKDLQCYETEPLVASCGLDRFVRIHNYKTKELKHKFYLKSRLNCLFLSKDVYSEKAKENQDNSDVVISQDIEQDDENEDEAIWSKMEVVKPSQKRKKKSEVDESLSKTKKKKSKKSKI